MKRSIPPSVPDIGRGISGGDRHSFSFGIPEHVYPLVLKAVFMEGRLCVATRRGTAGNTVTGGVGFWLLGESLGDGGKILEVRKIIHVSPIIAAHMRVNIGEVPLELSIGVFLPGDVGRYRGSRSNPRRKRSWRHRQEGR